jgi:hypothetical protein
MADSTMNDVPATEAEPPAPPTPSSRPSRERKQVEAFKPVEKVEKAEVDTGPKGKGAALGDCENSTCSFDHFSCFISHWICL